MLGSFLGGMFIIWILSFFGIDDIIIDGLDNLFNIKINSSGLFLLAGIIGMITYLV